MMPIDELVTSGFDLPGLFEHSYLIRALALKCIINTGAANPEDELGDGMTSEHLAWLRTLNRRYEAVGVVLAPGIADPGMRDLGHGRGIDPCCRKIGRQPACRGLELVSGSGVDKDQILSHANERDIGLRLDGVGAPAESADDVRLFVRSGLGSYDTDRQGQETVADDDNVEVTLLESGGRRRECIAGQERHHRE